MPPMDTVMRPQVLPSLVVPNLWDNSGRRACLTVCLLALFLAAATDVNWAAAITNAIAEKARPLPLSAVRLTGGPLKHAQDLDAEYLLKLEPDRLLAGYRL